ncbi:type I-F CRISPR-associated protein Csy2 [Rhodoferax sp. WC2427]|uniref:type I-F CRISPR-associated protein Csy2 n=1 Tax=Rhodoferax sp. WC2427 TaxID=3234144 RepID=UPI00346556B4
MSNELPNNPTPHAALLVLPRLRVQNANAISSPLTWGFPSITAFTGLMAALARRLGADAGIRFQSVGVVCHGFEAQVTSGGYTRSFCLTRNPVLQDGSTAAIVEEGRVHLDITLVFEVQLSSALLNDAARAACAAQVGDWVAGMRIAGGSVMPPVAGTLRRPPRPQLVLLAEAPDLRAQQFKRLGRQWLPGFALVSRDDLLHSRLEAMRANTPEAQPTLLDAWLDLARINYRATTTTVWNAAGDAYAETVEWAADPRPGWLVPIPVGYAALSDLHPPGTVAGARDMDTPFRFVEGVYSIGQWVSPHRLDDLAQLTWRPEHTPATGLYRCTNAYQAPATDTYTPVTFID